MVVAAAMVAVMVAAMAVARAMIVQTTGGWRRGSGENDVVVEGPRWGCVEDKAAMVAMVARV